MTAPWRVIQGDVLDVLPTLEAESVDAIVTDPPYGLEFMGQEWDRLEPARNRQRWKGTGRKLIGDGSGKGGGFAARMNEQPIYRPNRNSRCRSCGRYRFSGSPCGCDSPDWDTRAAEHSSAIQTWHLAWAREALRVLKPGGHLLAFGGTRTHHRLMCALEDAGFEIRDTLMWLYGSGFPKSLDVSKAIDKAAGAERDKTLVPTKPGNTRCERGISYAGESFSGFRDITAPATDAAKQWQGWGTALKPSFEPIVLARKPLSEPNVAANLLKWGTGALNIDGCRILNPISDRERRTSKPGGGRGGMFMPDGDMPAGERHNEMGRWPANVVLSHAPECREDCVPDCPVRMLDEQSGANCGAFAPVRGTEPTKDGFSGSVYGTAKGRAAAPFYADRGTASRFFYCAKASRSERGDGNTHPTVKPISLMRYLCRLVTPPGGLVLDPFCGSGSTIIAALREGLDAVGIERDSTYADMARRRIEGDAPLLNIAGGHAGAAAGVAPPPAGEGGGG